MKGKVKKMNQRRIQYYMVSSKIASLRWGTGPLSYHKSCQKISMKKQISRKTECTQSKHMAEKMNSEK